MLAWNFYERKMTMKTRPPSMRAPVNMARPARIEYNISASTWVCSKGDAWKAFMPGAKSKFAMGKKLGPPHCTPPLCGAETRPLL